MIYDQMLSERQLLSDKLHALQQQLLTLPTEKLIVTQYKDYYKWYVKNDTQLTYLPKSQRPLAQKLALRKYLLLLQQEIKKELHAIDAYLLVHSDSNHKSEKLLCMPSYHELLSPLFPSISQELHDWANSSYERNPLHPEQLIHTSPSGNLVRSKSEVYIDSALFKNGIPFRYECPLSLNGTVLYPDFTILHPHTRQLYYWEHFGLMDNNAYARNAYSKLQLYQSNQIIPSINLITTFETKEHPLSIDLVEKMIQYYFL